MGFFGDVLQKLGLSKPTKLEANLGSPNPEGSTIMPDLNVPTIKTDTEYKPLPENAILPQDIKEPSDLLKENTAEAKTAPLNIEGQTPNPPEGQRIS